MEAGFAEGEVVVVVLEKVALLTAYVSLISLIFFFFLFNYYFY